MGIKNHLGQVLKNARKRLSGRRGVRIPIRPEFRFHMEAAEVRESLGDEVWDSYFKFTIERNPFDRLVSFYFWRMKLFGLNSSFEDFANAVFDGRREELRRHGAGNFSNRPFYMLDAQLCVDYVIRYEELSSGIAVAMERIGLGASAANDAPRLKGGVRQGSGYTHWYSAELRSRAEEAFRVERRLFGYEFD